MNAWEEYREAVEGLTRLPAAVAARHEDLRRPAAAAEERRAARVETARAAAQDWHRAADAAERDSTARAAALGVPMSPPPRNGQPNGGTAEDLARALRQAMRNVEQRCVEVESERRVQRRRAEPAAPAPARAPDAPAAARTGPSVVLLGALGVLVLLVVVAVLTLA